uniref:Uncharacterized protein n=1 Tax=Plectus sambesii TaxID=2011161 RepID=A0A914UN60_9BILA
MAPSDKTIKQCAVVHRRRRRRISRPSDGLTTAGCRRRQKYLTQPRRPCSVGAALNDPANSTLDSHSPRCSLYRLLLLPPSRHLVATRQSISGADRHSAAWGPVTHPSSILIPPPTVHFRRRLQSTSSPMPTVRRPSTPPAKLRMIRRTKREAAARRIDDVSPRPNAIALSRNCIPLGAAQAADDSLDR